MSDRIPYVERLREDLVSAIAAEQARTGAGARRSSVHRWRPVAVAGAAAAVVALLAVVWPLRAPSALAITHEGETATVRLLDPDAGVEAMERELAAAGIDGRVKKAPVSPSLEGRWLTVSWIDGPPEQVPEEVGGGLAWSGGGTDVDGRTLELPTGDFGQVTLWLGRPAGPDELYWASGSAFAEGEPLHCSGVEGLRAREAEQVVRRMGYDVSWFTAVVLTDGSEDELTWGAESNPVERMPEGAVSGAEAASRTTVRLFVTPDGEKAPTHAIVANLGEDLDLSLQIADETGEPHAPSMWGNLVSPKVRCGD